MPAAYAPNNVPGGMNRAGLDNLMHPNVRHRHRENAQANECHSLLF